MIKMNLNLNKEFKSNWRCKINKNDNIIKAKQKILIDFINQIYSDD